MTQRKPVVFLEYLLRSAAMVALFTGLLFGVMKAIFNKSNGLGAYHIIDVLGGLDIIHGAFYAAIPAVFLILFAPAGKKVIPRKRIGGVFFGLCAVLCGATPIAVFLLRRDPKDVHFPLIIACVYVAVNVCSVLLNALGARRHDEPSTLLRYAWPVSDIVFPARLWIDYRNKIGFAANLFRPLPAALAAAALVLPWFYKPLPVETDVMSDPAFSRILPGGFYQVFHDASGRNLLAVETGTSTVFRLPEKKGARVLEFKDDAINNFQAVALDEKTRRLIHMGFVENKSRVLDADTLAPIALMNIAPAQASPLPLCRAYWNAERPLLFAVCDHGLTLMCPNGRQAKARYTNQPGDALYDARRDEILFLSWYTGITAFDPSTLLSKRTLALPKVVERMVMDETRDRLFVSAPKLSSVYEVDLNAFAVVRRIPVIPGARVLALDTQRDLIFIGSMAPYLEIRSLKDFSIVRRLSSPPWMRWMSLDSEGGRLYVATGRHGLWELDLKGIETSGRSAALERSDPFFRLFDRLGLELQDRLRWKESVIDPFIQKPSERMLAGECDPGLWTDQ